jgi:hypothetical protein
MGQDSIRLFAMVGTAFATFGSQVSITFMHASGLPDGLFLNQKSQNGKNFTPYSCR